MDILEELRWRGLIADCTDLEALEKRLAKDPITVYGGFDPSAESLHVGNLLPLLALRRFQLAGHHPIALAGGATGLIGDPSGKTAERQLLTPDRLERNIASVKEQLHRLLDFEGAENPARLLDNASWVGPVRYLDFLREVGKHFSVNMMIAKESVRGRMSEREAGISYTEFSYMLIQAFDFYHLRKEYDCELQIGGSDQWGNITGGIDLCRKKLSAETFGLTFPLIVNADGSKFGKSEEGAVWLTRERTSVYRFYQYFIQVDDRDVVRFLKYFTLLPKEEIEELEKRHLEGPEAREAHRALAREVTRLVHGDEAMRDAVSASELLFGGEIKGLTESSFREVAEEVPSHAIDPKDFAAGPLLVDLLAASGLCSSKGQARKDLQGGGIYVNNRRESDPNRKLGPEDLLFERYILLRKGKRNYLTVRID